jgi:hypothetical protein
MDEDNQSIFREKEDFEGRLKGESPMMDRGCAWQTLSVLSY